MALPTRDQNLDRTKVIKFMREGVPTVDATADFVSGQLDSYILKWAIPGTTGTREVIFISIGEKPTVIIKGGTIQGGIIK